MNPDVVPDCILAVAVQRVLLVMSEHFKHDRLALDVLDKGLCDLDGNLHQQVTQGYSPADSLLVVIK